MQVLWLYLLSLLILGLDGWMVFAQEGQNRSPNLPPAYQKLLMSPLEPVRLLSPKADIVLLLERKASVPLDVLARESRGLAGQEIDTKRLSLKRRSIYTGARWLDLRTKKEKTIDLPKNAQITEVSFSPDGRWLAVTVDRDIGLDLYLVAVNQIQVQRVKGLELNEIFSKVFQWSPDSKSLYVPGRVGQGPQWSSARQDVTVEESLGVKAPVRTFANLLKTPADIVSFEALAMVQWYRIDLKSRLSTPRAWGKPGLYTGLEFSPGGEQALVRRMRAPYSYAVPYSLFAQNIELWSGSVEPEVRVLFELPVAEAIPPEGVRMGPRQMRWNPDAASELIWVEALDGGDPRKASEFRDRLMVWPAPFEGQAQELYRFAERMSQIYFLQDRSQWLFREYSPETDLVKFSKGDRSGASRTEVFSYNSEEAYKHPGYFIQAEDGRGESRVLQDGPWIYLAGNGQKPDGEQPFLDRFHLQSGVKERLFEADPKAEFVEQFLFFLGGDPTKWIMMRESLREPGNYWLYTKEGSREEITRWVDQVPSMTAAQQRSLVYKRKDGVTLSGELFLPANYVAGTRLPTIIWAYPDEYRSSEVAGQVRASTRRYLRPSTLSVNWLVTQGYAVLDRAAMPLVGSKDTVNDTFLEQVKANAEAAIEALVKEGVSDRQRIAVGGHSYGAFMTANLLAHTPYFCAGIARSGAYNRSLTPFGFQAERRTFWEARDFYLKVSPFTYADQIKTPLLLIHGKDDNNPGTQVMQTERLFHALRGVGAKARMVLLPYESHSYRAEESILRVHAETLTWLERHCGMGSDSAKASMPRKVGS